MWSLKKLIEGIKKHDRTAKFKKKNDHRWSLFHTCVNVSYALHYEFMGTSATSSNHSSSVACHYTSRKLWWPVCFHKLIPRTMTWLKVGIGREISMYTLAYTFSPDQKTGLGLITGSGCLFHCESQWLSQVGNFIALAKLGLQCLAAISLPFTTIMADDSTFFLSLRETGKYKPEKQFCNT